MRLTPLVRLRQRGWKVAYGVIGILVLIAIPIVAQEQSGSRPAPLPSETRCPTATMDKLGLSGKNRVVDMIDDIECGDLDPANCERIQHGSVQGTVFDEAGKPAPTVDVRIESRSVGEVFRVTTNARGRYGYDGLRPGEYTVCVLFRGEPGLSRLLRIQKNRVMISDFDLGFFEVVKRQPTPAR